MSILPQVAREELELWLSREDEPDSVEHLMTVAADNIQTVNESTGTVQGVTIQ